MCLCQKAKCVCVWVPFHQVDIDIRFTYLEWDLSMYIREPLLYTIYFMCNTLLCICTCYYVLYVSMLYAVDAIFLHREENHIPYNHTFLLHFIVHTISNDIVFIIFKVVVVVFSFSLNTWRFFLSHMNGDTTPIRKQQLNAHVEDSQFSFVCISFFWTSSTTMLLCKLLFI